MANIYKLCTGHLVVTRSLFVLLSLFMVMSILSHQLRQWFVSNAVGTRLNMAYKEHGAPDYNQNNRNGNIIDLLALHKADSTLELPSTCEFPRVSLYEPRVVRIEGMKKKAIQCEGTYLPDLTYITQDKKLKVNTSKVVGDFQHCRYKLVFPHDTDGNSYKYSEWSQPFTDMAELPTSVEFVKVECINKNPGVVSKTFYGLIPRKEQFAKKDSLNFEKRRVMAAPKETLNVIMVGISTLPRNAFLRSYNKTYSYLMNTLKSFDLTMHSQLGDSIFPNILPLFTGSSEEEVKERRTHEYHNNSFDLIWRIFENAGYSTLFAEDMPKDADYFYLLRGFLNPFARYNMRPLALAMYNNKDMYRNNYYCAGNQLEVNVHLDYVNRFLNTFPDKPVFAVTMFTKPTHRDPSSARMFDDHFLKFYQSLNQQGHLKRSLLVSFSDRGVKHGALRKSVNGHVESKTPFTILTFPKWFLEKYPDVAANLQRNTKRLTSHYDMHATLTDLLYFRSNMAPPLAPLRHGISLFEKVPWNRTCKDAFIPSDWCLCGYKYLEDVYITSQLGTTLVNLVIKALNSKTDRNLCASFKLQQVIRIQKMTFNDDNSTGKREKIVYKVKLEVNPGNALFEADVYEINQFNEWKVGSDIARLNLYRGQADCLEFPNYRPFCYCKYLLSKGTSH